MNSYEAGIILVFETDRAEELIKKILVGQKVQAFGPDSEGLWGSSDKPIDFKIDRINIRNVSGNFFSMNVFPKGYNDSKEYGMIYTDKTFLKHIKQLLPSLYVSYSEQGMQGDNYVNFDVTIK